MAVCRMPAVHCATLWITILFIATNRIASVSGSRGCWSCARFVSIVLSGALRPPTFCIKCDADGRPIILYYVRIRLNLHRIPTITISPYPNVMNCPRSDTRVRSSSRDQQNKITNNNIYTYNNVCVCHIPSTIRLSGNTCPDSMVYAFMR